MQGVVQLLNPVSNSSVSVVCPVQSSRFPCCAVGIEGEKAEMVNGSLIVMKCRCNCKANPSNY